MGIVEFTFTALFLSHGDVEDGSFLRGEDDTSCFTGITMSSAPAPSDTHTLHTKVNLLHCTCSLDTYEDGILLDTPTLCTFSFELNDVLAKEGAHRRKSYYPRGNNGSKGKKRNE